MITTFFLDEHFEVKLDQNCSKNKVIHSKALCQKVARKLKIVFKLVNVAYNKWRPAGCYATKAGATQAIWFNDYEASSSGVSGGRLAICMQKGMNF